MRSISALIKQMAVTTGCLPVRWAGRPAGLGALRPVPTGGRL
jgi:hypothetical protein